MTSSCLSLVRNLDFGVQKTMELASVVQEVSDKVANIINSTSSLYSSAYVDWLAGFVNDTKKYFFLSDYAEIIDDLGYITEGEKVIEATRTVATSITTNKDINISTKKRWLSNISRQLYKFFGKVLWSIIVPILLVPALSVLEKEITPYIAQHEFAVLQKENPTCELRMIIHSTPLYTGKKMKNIETVLDQYEVVEVIDNQYGEKLKVRILGTDIEGWVYKKYTQRA